MCLFICLLITLAAFVSLPSAISLNARQAAQNDVDQHITQVRSALLAVSSIRSNNASEGCSDPNYAATLDGQGFDGQLVNRLLCEQAAGIDVFPDLDRAEREITTAYDGLTKAADPTSNTREPRFCQDDDLDIDALDNAGLDGPAIREIVCAEHSMATSASTSAALASVTTAQGAISDVPSSSITQRTTSRSTTSNSDSSSSVAPTSPTTVAGERSSTSSVQSTTSSTRLFSSSSSASHPLSSSSASRSATSSTSLGSSLASSSSTLTSTTSTRLTTSPASSPSTSSSTSTRSTSSTSSDTSSRSPTIPTTSSTKPSSTAATPDNATVVVVTTFVTVTVSATPAADNATPNLPPLRFTLESRVIAEGDPAATTSQQMTWLIGPPLSFPDPRENQGSNAVSPALTTACSSAM